MEVSTRLSRWVTRVFEPGSAERVLEALAAISADQIGHQDAERVQAALVVRTGGQWNRFVEMRELLDGDRRDVLVDAGLGDDDWRIRLDALLGG
jgi:hypothetical protein